ncbi:hypothetical protein ACIA5D_46885 [Actinoplanes sp. NPDC051513]|uniref:hypothetical protein n=1 Tax=Actinoplanes sp. NPDC051513 TaxID=3363908 RepID=UPI00378929B3
MHRNFGRRLLTGLAAATLACTFAAPANAAPAPTVEIAVLPATVAAGGSTFINPILYSPTEVVLEGGKMTYELSDGLTGVTLHDDTEDGPDCTEDGPTKLTCTTTWSTYVGPGGAIGDFLVAIDAAEAALGETGKITATFSADGLAPVSQSVDVTVAEGVDLAAGAEKSISLKPGAKFDASLQVHNTTDAVVHGAALVFGTDYAFVAPEQFSNCFYNVDELNACQFDQELEPGVTYQVVLPYQLRATTAAPSNQAGEFEWLTAGDYDDLIKFVDTNGYEGPGQAGNGGKLTLKALPAAKSLAKQKQTDTDPDNNWQQLSIQVTGNQGTDFAAVGATVKGKTGDKVTANIGVRNNGPATRDSSRNGGPAAVAIVTIPDGTKVVGLPDACSLSDYEFLKTPRGKGEKQYACFSDTVFPAKTTVTWPFQLEITKVADNATGWVEVNPACECDVFQKDLNKGNDVAKIVVNPVAAPGNGNGGAGEGDTGGEGGGLPITGPQTALFGAAGLILVVAGVGGVLFARRRRTRFEV